MRKYAVVNIVGGLGNQIFTISFAEYLKKQGYEVLVDTSFYTQSHDYPRELALDIKEFGFKEIKLKKNTLFKITNSLHQELDSVDSFKPKFINRFEGYYQDISYLDTDFLKKKLKIPSETQENTLMVHIRRGDYVGLDENLKINYYKKQLKQYLKKSQI
jgi:UDP-N-acetylglucosamine:LPS N-acetylglucosamine transferase